MTQLRDAHDRQIDYLRMSVTDRCDFRCTYCMAENMTFLPKKDLLTLEEMDRLCSAFIARGVKKLRLTGGEPLVRKNVMSLVESLSRHLESGALEASVGLPMNAETSHVMLCGNPQMVRDTQQLLKETRQMTKHLRRRPGHMTAEHYW